MKQLYSLNTAIKGGDILNVLTKYGFKRPTYDELLGAQVARAKLLFGDDIETSELSILGKFIRLNVFEVSKLYEELELIYYARFPHTATGTSLDRLCVFNGISRNPAVAAIHKIKILGEAGKTIKAGDFLVGTSDNITFFLLNDVKLKENTINNENVGVADALVECVEKGVVGNVPIGAINKIIQPNLYVKTIKHLGINSFGSEIETDVSLRKRFEQTVSNIGSGTIDSLYSSILSVTGVTGCFIVENSTNIVIDNRPPKTFECYVLGGNSVDIAKAIFNKIPIGIKTVSTVEPQYSEQIDLTDLGGTSHTIYFSRTKEKEIYIKINIKVDNYFDDGGVDEMKNAIVEHFSKLSNGEDVIFSALFFLVHKINGVVSASIELSVDNLNFVKDDIIVAGFEVARTNADSINVEVVKYVDR